MDNRPTLREQLMGWCRHFTGIGDPACKLGIIYDEVADKSGGPLRLPCIAEHGCSDRCQQAHFPSMEEVEPTAHMIEERMAAFLTDLLEGVKCPHCGTPIEKREQIGRCIQALPCGCRIGQGRLKKPKGARHGESS